MTQVELPRCIVGSHYENTLCLLRDSSHESLLAPALTVGHKIMKPHQTHFHSFSVAVP